MIQTYVSIKSKTKINHDCYRLKLRFIDPLKSFKITIAQSININAMIKKKLGNANNESIIEESVSRRYSIISPSSLQDQFQIIFKVYYPCQAFPQGGKMTTYLETLQVQDILKIQGPFSRFQYESNGNITLNGDMYKFKRIFFMAGGSGITPCYQTLKQIYQMKNQKIQLILLFANKTEEDIILKKQLDQMGQRVKIFYLLQKFQQDWKGLKGLITPEVLQNICQLNDPQTLYVHCGPVGMTKVIVLHFMKNHPNMRLFKF